MKVLFVASGNWGITSLVSAQAASLRATGIYVDVFPVKGRGLPGYLKNIPKLHSYVKSTQPDLVHAHYSFCGFISAFATRKPVVTSLMGSDVRQNFFLKLLTRTFSKYAWKATIVKSPDMKSRLGLADVVVIPNGVDLKMFLPLNKQYCRNRLGWDLNKNYILFIAARAKERDEKNLALAREAIDACHRPEVRFEVVSKVAHQDIPVYLNACDLLLLTSKWEGSPNVIKEAMACNTPIVAVNVGDIKILLGKNHGYGVSKAEATDLAKDIIDSLEKKLPCRGRERILELGLDSQSIASQIKGLYGRLINRPGEISN